METAKIKLLNQAIREHGYNNISPCRTAKSFDECYTIQGNILRFWFNDETGNTITLETIF